MASLAESSVASVPILQLAQLHDHLLHHRQSNADAPQTLPEAAREILAHDSQGARHTNASDDNVTPEVPESANAYRTPTSSPSPRPPPRLSSSKSAPAAEMEAMIQPSPSQKAFTDMTKASSFNGYPGGDTQPMESQIYRDYTKSMSRPPATTTPRKSTGTIAVQVSPDGRFDTYDTTATEKTPQACVEGETGYIDLAQAWQPGSPAAHSASDLEELLASPETQLQTQEPFLRPPIPGTPLIAGYKRNCDGEIVSPTVATVKKTPGLSQFFGAAHNGPMLSATQLFNQTQAPSSPMNNVPRSDPVMTRPSPNLHEQRNVSSPFATISSPVLAMHDRPASTMGGEPRDNYTSMRESQERRAARFRKEMGLVAAGQGDDDDDDDDEYSQRRRLEQMKLQRALSDQDLSRFRAPPRAGSRPSSSRKTNTTIDLVTPATTHKFGKVDFDLTSDADEEGDMAAVEEDHAEADDQDEDDVYDELNQAVLRSQSNLQEDEEDHESVEEDLVDEDIADDEVPKEGDQDHGPPNSTHLDGLDASVDIEEQRVTGTQRSAIADSQPERLRQLNQVAHSAAVHHSSMSSFVPGSQYAGKTSQDQLRLTPAIMKRSSASQPNGSGVDDKVPSSPPLPQQSSTIPENTAEASLARREMLAQFQPRHGASRERLDDVDEIPESDLPGSDSMRPQSANDLETAPQRQCERNNVPPYSTAQTHLSTAGPSPTKVNSSSQKSPVKVLASQQSQFSAPSPRRAAGIRRFASIAADPSPPDADGDLNMDIDDVMGDIMTADDQQFLDVVSSPPSQRVRKRRRVLPAAFKEETTSLKDTRADVPPSDAIHEAATAVHPVAEPQDALLPTAPTVATRLPSAGSLTEPCVANDVAIPDAERDDAPYGTQDSVKKREAAGAHAVSQLISTRSKKLAKIPKADDANAAHPTPTPNHDAEASTMTKHAKSKNVNDAKARRGSRRKARNEPNLREPLAHIDTAAASELPQADLTTEALGQGVQQPPVTETSEGGTAQISAPHRVFALFGGTYNAYYSATWLATNADASCHSVRFDDTTVAHPLAHQVRSLDLRIGDQVKVDGKGMRNTTYIIQGFGPVVQTDEDKALGTDVYGHVVVKVRAKAGRGSLPAANTTAQPEGEVLEVLVADIYITTSMWSHHVDRPFTVPDETKKSASRAETPSSGVHTPNVDTPGSRSRRPTIPSAKTRTSHLREDSVTSFEGSRVGSAIFAGMAFAISYIKNEDEKAAVTKRIQQHGGLVLEEGFDEIFELPNIQDDITTTTSGKKRSPRKSLPPAEPVSTCDRLRLKHEHRDLGFVALIADHHSRRAKYMQALALGLPTLSGKWILDSIDAHKHNTASPTPLPWSKYLLPAGESTYLGKAIRSRTMPIYSAAEAKLQDIVSQRDDLLHGDGVLIVAALSKKGNSAWQRRKAYAFLTLALGAGKIRRVSDLDEAKAAISESDADDGTSSWKWVYVDGSVAEAGAVLFKKGVLAGDGRKRSGMSESAGKGRDLAMSVGDGNVKVVNDEYVVQSLILGALVD